MCGEISVKAIHFCKYCLFAIDENIDVAEDIFITYDQIQLCFHTYLHD